MAKQNSTRNARAIRASFQVTLRSGVKGLATVVEAVDWAFAHGDTSLLANMLKDAEGQKPYQDALKLVIKGIWPHAAIGDAIKVKRKVDGEQFTIENKDAEAVIWLANAVAEGRSLLSDALKERFGAPKVELTDQQRAAKAAKRDAKMLAKDGFPVSPEEYYKMILAEMAKLNA